MNTMKKIYLTALLVSVLTVSMIAQDTDAWTLDDCIIQAMENNITLKRQELSAELDRKDLTQSKLNLLPNLNGQVEHNLGSGRVLDRGTYQWLNTDVSQGDLGMVSNVTLFGGLKGYNAIKMSEANYNVSRANLKVMENNLLLQVMNGYLELLRRTELYEIAVEKARITNLQVERMKKLVEVGNASMGDLLEVSAQASKEIYNTTQAGTLMESTRLSLVQILNLNSLDSFEIVKPAISDPSLLQIPGLAEVFASAVEILPMIEGAEQQIHYQEKNLAHARGSLSPELYIRALYYSNYSDKLINPREIDPFNPVLEYPVDQQILDNQYRQVSVGLNIPVFNKWQNRTNISKAKINLLDAQYQLDDTKQQLFKAIQGYHADARGALDNYEAAERSFANSEEAYRYAEEKFKVGMVTVLELEEARNRLFETRSEMTTSKFEFVFYMKILDFYQGKAITLQE